MESALRATAAALGAAALVASAGAAHASATVDLIWAETGTSYFLPDLPSILTAQVILTAGPNAVGDAAIWSANVSVDYSGLGRDFSVVGFSNTTNWPLLVTPDGPPIDTGSRIDNINGSAYPIADNRGLEAGQSQQLGTVTFHRLGGDGEFWIQSDANGPLGGIVTAADLDITDSVTFNRAFAYTEFMCICDFRIDVNTLRGGSPTVTVGKTKDISAKARIAKGTAQPGTTLDSTLRIDAIDGGEIIDSRSSGPIQLAIGKGGDGDTLTMSIPQCNSGSIVFRATFSGPAIHPDHPLCANQNCDASRTLERTCK